MRPPRGALLAVAALVVLPLLLLAPALRPGHALLSVAREQLAPWRADTPPERLEQLRRESQPLGADKTLMFEPQLELAQRRLLAGEAPLWNPDSLCGVPLLAQAVHGALSPPTLLAAAFGTTRAWALIAALQTALAGLLMYLLAREYALGPAAALLAGLSFAFCGYLAVRLEWYQIQGASIWLPAALLAVERAFRGARGAALLLAAGVGLSLLAGFPQASVHLLYAAAALAAVRCVGLWRGGDRPAARRGALACAGGVLVGVLLGAPQLLPSAQYAAGPDSARHAEAPEAIAAFGLDPVGLLAAVVPELFGHPRDLARHQLPHLQQDGVLRRLLCRPGSNWVETTCSIGLPALLLALLGLAAARRGVRVGAALFLLGALLAVRTPLLPLALHLPGLSTGDPRRFLLLFAAGGALLAGFGLQRLLDEGPARWFVRTLAGVSAGLVLACALTLWLDGPRWLDLVAPPLAAQADLAVGEVRAQAAELQLDLLLLRAALLHAALVAGLATGAALIARRHRAWGAGALLVLASAELLGFASRAMTVLPTAPPREPPGLQLLRDPEGGRLARFVADPAAAPSVLDYPLPPNTGLPFGVHDLSGYITLAPRRLLALHELLQPGTATEVGLRALSDPAALDSPLLDVLAVSRVLSTAPLARPGLAEIGRVGEAWLYENVDALPRVRLATRVQLVASEAAAAEALAAPGIDLRAEVVVEARGDPAFEAAAAGDAGGTARLRTDEPERLVIEVQAERPAVLVIADGFDASWEARLDGAPTALRPADLALRAVAVPAGAHRVELRYRPAGWRYGWRAGVAGVLGLLLCAWAARPLRRG